MSRRGYRYSVGYRNGVAALRLLQSLVADIDAMDQGEEDGEHWFGPFSAVRASACPHEHEDVSWPNLAILRDEAKKLLSEVGP